MFYKNHKRFIALANIVQDGSIGKAEERTDESGASCKNGYRGKNGDSSTENGDMGVGLPERAFPLDSHGVKSGVKGNRVGYNFVSGTFQAHGERIDKRFTPAKRRGVAMALYVREQAGNGGHIATAAYGSAGMLKLSLSLRGCRNQLLFRAWHDKEDRITLAKMHSCKQSRLCPLCAVAWANQHAVAVMDRAEIIRRDRPDLRGYFVTLTVQNGASLDETYRHLVGSTSVMTQRIRDNRKGSNRCTAMAGVVGGVASYEIKRGAGSGLWHPHVHALWWSDRALDAAAVREEWREITRDSHIVDVQEIDPTDPKSILEICKYALKHGELSLADNLFAAIVLRHRRLFRTYGIMYGIKPDPSCDIDETTVYDGPFTELLYEYVSGSYALRSVTENENGHAHTEHGHSEPSTNGVPTKI